MGCNFVIILVKGGTKLGTADRVSAIFVILMHNKIRFFLKNIGGP